MIFLFTQCTDSSQVNRGGRTGLKSAQKPGRWPFVWLWSAFENQLDILYSGVLCLW